jgi:hypothetical protein
VSSRLCRNKVTYCAILQLALFRQFSWRPKLDGLSFNSIGVVEVSWLERAFESGVFEVVRTLNGDKALAVMVSPWLFFRLVGWS